MHSVVVYHFKTWIVLMLHQYGASSEQFILYISEELKQLIHSVNVTIPSWEIFIWSDIFSKTASSWKMHKTGNTVVKVCS